MRQLINFIGSWRSIFTLLLLVLSSLSFAQDEDGEGGEEGEEGGPPPAQAIYIPVKPAFVVNYGGAGRLRYIKAEVSVRVSNLDAANAVQYHLPFIRHKLVMLFAEQTNESVSSQDGKEKIRMDATEKVRDILEAENQVPREDVVDVFFNSFYVQK